QVTAPAALAHGRAARRGTPRHAVGAVAGALLDARQVVAAGPDGYGTFPEERLTGPVFLPVAPGIGARYELY
ncbi:hypothetical protein BE11_25735, partial [Sorangium cellulosum]